MRWAGHVARMVATRALYKVLVGKSKRNRPLGRPRPRWDDIMDFPRVGYGGMDCIDLAQDRNRCRALVNTVMDFRVP
jgi:hypothetical protein